MIVLGPHVLSHHPPEEGNDPYHVDEEEDEDVDQQNVEEEDGDEFDDGEEAAAWRLDDDDDDDDDDDRIFSDARSDASRSLGSIGAPPLTPPSRLRRCLHCRRRRRRRPDRHHHLFHRATTDLARTHVDLLRTMRVVLGTIRAGTSVRLGLGPVAPHPFVVVVVEGGGGGRATRNDGVPVARAEGAWEARRSRLLLRSSTTRRRHRHRGGIGRENRPSSGDDGKFDDDVGDEDDDEELPATTLTFQKLRDVLYRAIVDQAGSLRDALEYHNDGATTNTTTTMAEWETFALDLRHSVSPGRTTRPPPLTLSRLSDLIDRLGGYLSFVLSVFLDDDDDAAHPLPGASTSSSSSLDRIDRDRHRLRGNDLEDRIVAGIARSSQFARERAAYLRSACPSSRPPREDEIKAVAAAVDDDDDDDDDDDGRGIENAIIETNNIATREGRRGNGPACEDALLKLHSAFEAARVSLWAFGCHREIDGRQRHRSYDAADNDGDGAGRGEGEIEDARVWWSHFKDFVERTRASILDVEGHFLLDDGCDPREKETPDDVGPGVPSRNDVPAVAETSEHVCHAVDGNVDGESCLMHRGGGGDESKYAGKTLVFAGSGVGRTRRSRAARAGPASGRRPPPSDPRAFDAADHAMLLRDLERRIRTMGLPRVHEVVADTDLGADVGGCVNGESDAMPDRSAGRRRNDPFFLGASGSLLAELTSAINGTPSPEGREEDVCSSADSFPSPSA